LLLLLLLLLARGSAGLLCALTGGWLAAVFKPVGLPTCTLPFCLATLAFMLLQDSLPALRSIPLSAITTPEAHLRAQRRHTQRAAAAAAAAEAAQTTAAAAAAAAPTPGGASGSYSTVAGPPAGASLLPLKGIPEEQTTSADNTPVIAP
jgi:hypothetical protein